MRSRRVTYGWGDGAKTAEVIDTLQTPSGFIKYVAVKPDGGLILLQRWQNGQYTSSYWNYHRVNKILAGIGA